MIMYIIPLAAAVLAATRQENVAKGEALFKAQGSCDGLRVRGLDTSQQRRACLALSRIVRTSLPPPPSPPPQAGEHIFYRLFARVVSRPPPPPTTPRRRFTPPSPTPLPVPSSPPLPSPPPSPTPIARQSRSPLPARTATHSFRPGRTIRHENVSYLPLHECPNGCNERGNCTALRECECSEDYLGPDCSIAACSDGCPGRGIKHSRPPPHPWKPPQMFVSGPPSDVRKPKARVAVVVTGQLGRLELRSKVRHLALPNVRRNVSIVMVLALQDKGNDTSLRSDFSSSKMPPLFCGANFKLVKQLSTAPCHVKKNHTIVRGHHKKVVTKNVKPQFSCYDGRITVIGGCHAVFQCDQPQGEVECGANATGGVEMCYCHGAAAAAARAGYPERSCSAHAYSASDALAELKRWRIPHAAVFSRQSPWIHFPEPIKQWIARFPHISHNVTLDSVKSGHPLFEIFGNFRSAALMIEQYEVRYRFHFDQILLLRDDIIVSHTAGIAGFEHGWRGHGWRTQNVARCSSAGSPGLIRRASIRFTPGMGCQVVEPYLYPFMGNRAKVRGRAEPYGPCVVKACNAYSAIPDKAMMCPRAHLQPMLRGFLDDMHLHNDNGLFNVWWLEKIRERTLARFGVSVLKVRHPALPYCIYQHRFHLRGPRSCRLTRTRCPSSSPAPHAFATPRWLAATRHGA